MGYRFGPAKCSIGRTFMVRHENLMHDLCAARHTAVLAKLRPTPEPP